MGLPDGVQENFTCDKVGALQLAPGKSYYEGIPETLMINFASWVALVILFAVLRKIAWNYGRIALVNRKEERKGGNHSERWTELFYGDMDCKRKDNFTSQVSLNSIEPQMTEQHVQRVSWVSVVFRLREDHIASRCGLDAVQYLQFQQYLIVYMAIIMLLSLAVILPVNISGSGGKTMSSYAHSTISNVNSDSPKLWVHTLMALIFLIIALGFMRRFSATLDIENEEDSARTLMLAYIPKDKCFKNTITQHFKEAYPDAVVEDVQFSFNIQKLAELDENRRRAHEGKTTSEALLSKTGSRPKMVPYYFGRLCCCCQTCGCRQVDALDYYTEEERRLEASIEREKVNAFQECTGIAFIIFESEEMAHKIYYDHNGAVCSRTKPQTSSITKEVGANNWDVEFAPDPNDIYWQNLSLSPCLWWLRALIINGGLLVVLFFLTTPSVLLNNKARSEKNSNLKNAVQAQFLPSLLLWFFSIMLPYLVFYSDQFIGHWTRTKEHQTVMRKTFTFLLLMIVILPSLGLPSAKAFLEYAFNNEKLSQQLRWGCIFLPGNSAFFVNYVITSAFIGNALTLIRFPELTMYVLRMLAARSAYEQSAVRRAVIWEFQFGQEYAWMLCIFTVVMAYSVISPLVTIFGLVYLIGKYYMDRYNLYYAYKPSKINHHIHTSAINFVIISLIILQFVMLFYNTIQTSWRHGLPIFSGFVVFLSLLLLVGRLVFGWFNNWAPIKYRQFENKNDEETMKMTGSKVAEHDQWHAFMPTVLERARADSSRQPQNRDGAYGATEVEDNSTTQILDASAFADPEYINTSLRNYESSPSVTESESEGESGSPETRATLSRHDQAATQSETNEDVKGRSYPLPPAARSQRQTPKPRARHQ
ncbi:calcium permeable stress-gated cation channel 1-like [Watersipora subatra]|uniref:calcium permeable stress-gated cation channel 1-like n=1 Tax=Watersipora subatra TaxID=2589382 RepID=UPI00355C69C2